MDSKKYYKKFGTIFWWSLTILPFLLIVWSLMVALVNYNRLGASADTYSNILEYIENILSENILESSCNFVAMITPSILLEPMKNLFSVLFVNVATSDYVGIILAYMVWISFLHLLFDFMTFIPNVAHKLLDKWGCFKQ